MPKDNQFNFTQSDHFQGLTCLHAVIHDFEFTKHSHEEYALGVTLEGRHDFSCKGVHFKNPPGGVISINPEEVHDGNSGTTTTLKYAMLYVHPNEFTPLIDSAANGKLQSHKLPDSLLEDPRLRAYILSLSHLAATEGSSKLEQEFLLYKIANRLTQHIGKATPNQWASTKDPILLKTRDYIHDHIAHDLSVDELSGIANLSKYHFIRMFRNQFGITPHQYVLNCRINKARTMLAGGSSPTAVAHDLGFVDVSHLNRRFKQSYGITPKQYYVQSTKKL